MELSVTTSRQDDVSVVTVAGEVDVYTAAQLRSVLDEEIGAGHARLEVDLDEVSFLDSTGLGVLVGRLKLVRNHSGWLRIVCSNDRILRVFRITGLEKVFGIHDSLEDALAAFEGTVLAVTHDRWFARGLDRFLVFRADGRVVASDEPVWDEGRVARPR